MMGMKIKKSDDENTSIDENQNLKDFILYDKEDSESDDGSYSEHMLKIIYIYIIF